jgi:hypothetical protein
MVMQASPGGADDLQLRNGNASMDHFITGAVSVK